MPRTKMLIDGNWVESKSTFKSVNPSTGDSIGQVDMASESDVQQAVSAANDSFYDWKEKGVEERANILSNVVDLLYENYGEQGEVTPLKQLIIDETGKRLPDADIEVVESADFLKYFVEKGPEVLRPENLELNEELWPTKESTIYSEPIGVVGVIKPWNYPLELPIWSIGAALIAGNTVVLKPSELSSFVGKEIGRIFKEAGLPDGVINVITGDGETGRYLVESDIDMISFTGGQSTGKEIANKCSSKLVQTTLELGGNDAAIVTPDVDLELAANGLVWGAFTNAGQVCVGAKRLFVHESIAEEFIGRVKKKTEELQPGRDYGPIISQHKLNGVMDQVKKTIEEGAELYLGGDPISDKDGFYFEPTILINVSPEMEVMKEECFGPVMPIMKVGSIEEGINLANSSEYGLGASVWTENIELGNKVAKNLEAGMVWINDINVAFARAPWGGTKSSGNGGVELGKKGIKEYVNIKHVNVETGSADTRDWWFPYSD